MVQAPKLRFVLTGFTQDGGFRVFAFTRVGADQIRTEFTVKADLALSRKYAIRVQELPLLCRFLLERHDNEGETRTFTFTEDEMSIHARECAVARTVGSAKKRRPSEIVGAAPQTG